MKKTTTKILSRYYPRVQSTCKKLVSDVNHVIKHEKVCKKCINIKNYPNFYRYKENTQNRFTHEKPESYRNHRSGGIRSFYALEQENLAHETIKTITQVCKKYDFNKKELPNIHGIYVVISEFKNKLVALYVGKSDVSIRKRWSKHHKYSSIREYELKGHVISIYCLFFPLYDKNLMLRNEQELIFKLKPVLNCIKYTHHNQHFKNSEHT